MTRKLMMRWLSPLLTAAMLFAAFFPAILPTNASILKAMRLHGMAVMANAYYQYVSMLCLYPTEPGAPIAIGGPPPNSGPLGVQSQTYTQEFLYGVSYDATTQAYTPIRVSTDGSLIQPLQSASPIYNYSLSSGNDGNVYGVMYMVPPYTGFSGGFGQGFEITEDGVLNWLPPSIGNSAITLFRGIDGQLYGEGSLDTTGTPAGAFLYETNSDQINTIMTFPNTSTQTITLESVGQAADGDLFGVLETSEASDTAAGSIFRIAPDGSGYVNIHSFTSASPEGEGAEGLVDGKDGFLYGHTTVGGPTGVGTAFRIAYDGSAFETIANSGSIAPAIYASDRHVYGYDPLGTDIDSLTPSVAAVAVTLPGSSPVALVQGPDGTVYGISQSSDPARNGFFRVNLGLPPVNYMPKTQVGWVNTDAALSLWDYDPILGGFMQNTYGPLYGSTATSVATAPDGTSRVLWDNLDGSAYVWSVDNSTGWVEPHTFGPYPGWTAKSLCVSPDGITHILWTNTSGAAALWNYDPDTGKFTEHALGPFAGWTATSITDGVDGRTRILWNNAGGAASIWSLDDTFGVFSQNTFGPYPGWTATALSASPTTTHVLWTNSGGAASLWSYDTVGGGFTQNTFGPYPNWSAVGLADREKG
ncbi:MAG: choice-of-anchor tandem repeat GloVer-containing protein, partial [Capsulimonadaceae bacterium]